jgi:hypothetical protein
VTRARPRIRPMWSAGLRRGRVRDTMTAFLKEHPDILEELRQIHERLKAWGIEPISMKGVKEPFDYEPRR